MLMYTSGTTGNPKGVLLITPICSLPPVNLPLAPTRLLRQIIE
ncbi:MAG: hypothetical protein ACSLEN_04595 [Candidatus Malihini olakiniferum]